MKYPDRQKQPQQQPEPYSLLCCDFDEQGNRCSATGTMTESLRGSDRWYCHRHFGPFRGLDHWKGEPVSRDYVSGRGMFEKQRDGHDWAREIMALDTAGTYHSSYGVECAREVLGWKA